MRATPTLSSILFATLLLPLALAPGCAPLEGAGEENGHGDFHEADDDLAVTDEALTVAQAASTRCSTSSVRGLSLQLVEEIQCIRPGTMESIAGIPGTDLGSAVVPYLQRPAARALRDAVSRRSTTMYINSALRTLPQQYLLHRWYREGRCGIALAARPGTSNHETGVAVDIEGFDGWRSTMSGAGYRWLGSSDPVHFDYVGGGTVNLSSLSVLAFQRLWNRANPGDRIPEDGAYGPATESRLVRAPGEGFATGATCGSGSGSTSPAPAPSTAPAPTTTASMEVGWVRRGDGRYSFRAIAPSAVVRVDYVVDGYRIGQVARSESAEFAALYGFSAEGTARALEARGFDASGRPVALAIGFIDVSAATAVFVRQTGTATYEIGLERAPAGVAAIEVEADGYLLTDAIGGGTRSTRLAVRSRFSQLGTRNLAIRTYEADGRLRGTLRRTLTLR